MTGVQRGKQPTKSCNVSEIDRVDIFLVRHGKAEAGGEDRLRPLSRSGRGDSRLVAEMLERAGVRPVRIEHSDRKRAYETAEILAHSLRAPLTEVDDLAPDADVRPVSRRLHQEAASAVMLVGHNPFMERLAALLISGDADASILTMHTASVGCLRPDGLRFSCDWLVKPGVLRSRE